MHNKKMNLGMLVQPANFGQGKMLWWFKEKRWNTLVRIFWFSVIYSSSQSQVWKEGLRRVSVSRKIVPALSFCPSTWDIHSRFSLSTYFFIVFFQEAFSLSKLTGHPPYINTWQDSRRSSYECVWDFLINFINLTTLPRYELVKILRKLKWKWGGE